MSKTQQNGQPYTEEQLKKMIFHLRSELSYYKSLAEENENNDMKVIELKELYDNDIEHLKQQIEILSTVINEHNEEMEKKLKNGTKPVAPVEKSYQNEDRSYNPKDWFYRNLSEQKTPFRTYK